MKYLVSILLASFSIFTFSHAGAQPFKHPFGEWRVYNGAWLAVCPERIESDKQKFGHYHTHCWSVAGSLQKNDIGFPVYSFRIYQDRETGKQEFGFIYAPADSSTLNKTKPLEISVDGRSIASLSFETDLETRHNTSNEYFIKDDQASAKLIANLRKGANMTASFPLIEENVSSVNQVSIWLKGVRASEKFMKAYSKDNRLF